MDRVSNLSNALDVWAPTYPRNINRKQREVTNKGDALPALLEAEDDDYNEPFVSVYSFPRGHTKQSNIPRIDTLFIDFDFESGEYEPGSGDVEAWRRDISQLLVRIRRVAKFIQSSGTESWRASLSGHKGVHLFHDFEPLDPEIGAFSQYIAGVNEYANEVVERLVEGTGLTDLENYVDVTSSDLGRLCRVPNTVHGGATRSFEEPRYCVPVTIDELADITVDTYRELTSQPRAVPWDGRNPNSDATEVIERYVETSSTFAPGSTSAGDIDYQRVEEYKEQSNDSIDLYDVKFLTSDRPCVWEYHLRDDKWDFGAQSHFMEIYCIREMIEKGVPIDVMKEFFADTDGYDERYTEQKIKDVIARGYNRFRTKTILRDAPEFCGYDHCTRCQRILNND